MTESSTEGLSPDAGPCQESQVDLKQFVGVNTLCAKVYTENEQTLLYEPLYEPFVYRSLNDG